MYKTIIIFLLLIVCNAVMAIKPFYSFGVYNKSINTLTAEVTKALKEKEFDVVGMYKPSHIDSLEVIVFTNDDLTSLATGVADKGAFGSTLKIGLIKEGNLTRITMTNPYYFVHSYFNGKANVESIKYITWRVDSLARSALNVFSSTPLTYGVDMSIKDLNNYKFLPTMAEYSDALELEEYDEFLDAVTTIKQNLLNHVDDSELVYELFFEDKEIAVFGVGFNGNSNLERELLEFIGVKTLPSFPFEILIQGEKAYILNPKYRIPLYQPDISMLKVFKIFGLSSDIKDCMQNIAEISE